MPNLFKLIRSSDYSISTWLLLGACIQTFIVVLLPRNVALLPPFLFLVYRIVRDYLVATGRLRNPVKELTVPGRMTAQFPSPDGTLTHAQPSSDSIVLLILTVHFSHPNGRFCPGGAEMGAMFNDMWVECEAQRETWGYLGNSPALVTELDGGDPTRVDDKGRSMIYLSYWKNLDGLHAFARSSTHMKGWKWWDTGAMKKYRHIGIGHEVYDAPAGKWENVYHNHAPFGLGNIKFPVRSETAMGDEKAPIRWVNGLRSAKGRQWKNMEHRLGRAPGSIGLKKGDTFDSASDIEYSDSSEDFTDEKSERKSSVVSV